LTTSTTRLSALIIWAIVWAAAMIAAAIVLKGNPIKDWIQSALFIAAMSFWVWQAQRAARKYNHPSTYACNQPAPIKRKRPFALQ
jgi:hypothetical protein